MNERRDIFLYIHIPKCGGTTFGSVLKNNFGAEAGSDDAFFTYRYNSQQVEEMIRNYPFLKSFSSHKFSLDLPFHLEDIKIHPITFVRNPVDRFISHYFYHRTNRKSNAVPSAKSLNFREYIIYALTQKNQPGYINGQTRYLSGSPNSTGLHKIKKLVEEGNLLLFPLDRIDESLLALERLFPHYLKNCAYVMQNVSSKDQDVTDQDRQLINQFVRHDFELLHLGNLFLDSLIDSIYPNKRALEKDLTEFHGRCKRLQRKTRLKAFVRPVYRAACRIAGF